MIFFIWSEVLLIDSHACTWDQDPNIVATPKMQALILFIDIYFTEKTGNKRMALL